MKDLSCSLTGPAGLLIVACGVAVLIGIDPWRLARYVALCLPIVAYVVCANWTMAWAMNVGPTSVQRNVNGHGWRSVWYGVLVVLCLMVAAAGFCVMVVAAHLQRWLGGAS